MRACAICGKGSQMSGTRKLLRGHYNQTTVSRKYPNLQWARISGVRKKVCTQCMKRLARGK